jgi:hypothetical protein
MTEMMGAGLEERALRHSTSNGSPKFFIYRSQGKAERVERSIKSLCNETRVAFHQWLSWAANKDLSKNTMMRAPKVAE